jgi:hypothetical protein
MKNFLQLAVVAIGMLGCTAAQNLPLDRRTRELMLHDLENQPARATAEAAERRAARYREQQFIEKVNRFVQLWAVFAREYNEKGTFNVKAARETSKAFHDVEHSEDWPRLAR